MALKSLLPAALLLAVPLISACGYKGALTRLEPADPALSREQQNQARTEERQRIEDGLTVSADARPLRVDDLTVKLEVRRDDPFSLPPEGTQSSQPVPFPGETAPRERRPLPVPPLPPAAAPAQPAPQLP